MPDGSRSIGCGHLERKRVGKGAIGRDCGGCIGRAERTGAIGRAGAETEGTEEGAKEDTDKEVGAEKGTDVEAETEEGTVKEEIKEEGRLGVAIGLVADCLAWRCL